MKNHPDFQNFKNKEDNLKETKFTVLRPVDPSFVFVLDVSSSMGTDPALGAPLSGCENIFCKGQKYLRT